MDSINVLKKFWKNKNVFITGHTGFKGSWLSIALKLFGANLYGYSLKPKKNSLYNYANCKKIFKKNYFKKIEDKKSVERAIVNSNPDIIFHLAAQPLVSLSYLKPQETFNSNIVGTYNLLSSLNSSNKIKSVVIITTDKVYKIKNKEKVYREQDELGGNDLYSASKACCEILTFSFIKSFFQNKQFKNSISTARSGNVIGGGDLSKDRLIPDIMFAINNKSKLIIRNPNSIRPWQHVIEPTFGYLKLARLQYEKKNINKEPFWNFGPDRKNFIKVSNIANYIKKFRKFTLKYSNTKNFEETNILKLSNQKSKQILNWYPKWDIYKSLNYVIEWNDLYKQNKDAKKICEKQIREYLS